VDAILQELDVKKGIDIIPSKDGALMPGRGADLQANGQLIGCFGELHPLVIKNFGLEQPVVALEFRWGEL